MSQGYPSFRGKDALRGIKVLTVKAWMELDPFIWRDKLHVLWPTTDGKQHIFVFAFPEHVDHIDSWIHELSEFAIRNVLPGLFPITVSGKTMQSSVIHLLVSLHTGCYHADDFGDMKWVTDDQSADEFLSDYHDPIMLSDRQ